MEQNLVSFFESNARQLGEKKAVLWEGGDLPWSELDRRASGFARYLADQGVGPGDRVAILLPNRWPFVAAFIGILKLGATPAPLNPGLKSEELKEILSDRRPKQIIDDVKVCEGEWLTQRFTESPGLILYTSGSTGRPKGAVFSHRSLIGARLS